MCVRIASGSVTRPHYFVLSSAGGIEYVNFARWFLTIL